MTPNYPDSDGRLCVKAGAEPLVEARAVSKRYGTTLALDDVSMNVWRGQSVALAGRNGAGKSTMVRS